MYIEVAPAYGRDYKNQKEVKAAWAEGLDFIMTDTGQYVSKRDADAQGFSVIVRYADSRKVVQVQK